MFGTSAHKTTIKLIIETSLRTNTNSSVSDPLILKRPRREREHAQRLQTADACLGRERARHEREDGGAGLAEARDPADGAGEQPRREDARGVIHDERVDRPEEDADEGDRKGTADERGHEPDDELQSMVCRVRMWLVELFRSGGGRWTAETYPMAIKA